MYQPTPPTFGAPNLPPQGFGTTTPSTWGPTAQNPGNSYGHSGQDDRYGGKTKDPLLVAIKWIKARSQKEKMYMGIGLGVLMLLLFYFVVEDHDTLFIMAETVHFIGIGVLAYKLISKRNVGGLSLRTQELTAVFLMVRLLCSFLMEYDIHTVLDLMTLAATGGVIYTLRGPLRQSYQEEMDTVHPLFVIGPCLVVAFIAHPGTRHNFILRILWAFCVYLEAVSVLPQLRMMQKAKVIEKFTAHYVFALGLSRFISCAHWLLQIFAGDRFLWAALSSGLWPIMVLVSEVVQTFILADFCYYYVKSFAEGTGIVQLPAGVV